MSEIIKHLLARIKTDWRHPYALFCLILLVAIVALTVFLNLDLAKISISEHVITGLVVMGIALGWWVLRRPPRADKGAIGFAIAITTEDQVERQKITADFMGHLSNLLASGVQRSRFCLVDIPDYFARNVHNPADFERYLRQTRCCLGLYGRARVRRIQGRECHVLDLNCVVSHAPLRIQISNTISKEIRELLPSRFQFATEDDLLGFEVTANWIQVAALYILSMAMLHSYEIGFCEELLERLRPQVEGKRLDNPTVRKIRQRLPHRLADVYVAQASRYYRQWRLTESREMIERCRTYVNKLEDVEPNNYTGHLLRSICAFLADRDVATAIAEIRKCRDLPTRDTTWRYNYAFLLAYNGDMQQAIQQYKAAMRGYCSPDTAVQVEEFMLRVLDAEPGKTQLHFCIGLVNYEAKADSLVALEELETYLKSDPPRHHRCAFALAQTYVARIRRELRDASTRADTSI